MSGAPLLFADPMPGATRRNGSSSRGQMATGRDQMDMRKNENILRVAEEVLTPCPLLLLKLFLFRHGAV
ncbi:hypothetical protein GCM10017784_39450 [Deinococcus indicus]|nr:hypothetical protein GCM10017784_39450 [Deinococcus indicus]